MGVAKGALRPPRAWVATSTPSSAKRRASLAGHPSSMSARRNLIISAVSNLPTAYNLVVINVVHVVIEYQYCGGPSNCSGEIASASTSCLAGAIVGQLTFGYIGDWLGRGPALQQAVGEPGLRLVLSSYLLQAVALPSF